MRGTIVTSAATAFALLSCVSAFAQSANPTCQRLEAQLASLDRGNSDPGRADQIRRAEDAVNRQQYEVDRMVAQSRRMGCENTGFFSIFSNPPQECGGLTRQIGQQRNTLERLQMQLEQLNGGTTQRLAQRQSLMIALGENNCGPQYRAAVTASQRGGFFDRLFGVNNNDGTPSDVPGGVISSTPAGPMGGTFRTICVRTCDGYYYPISYSTSPERFAADEQTCQRTCPAAEAQLYTYHNPGEDVSQAVSLAGRPYSELPTAFAYRKAMSQACSCRRPGESWADALKVNGPDATVAPGDVVVTEQNARRLSQPRLGADGKPVRPDPKTGAAPANDAQANAPAPVETDPSKRTVRTVGPTFLPAQQR
ncbi:DUF2865 domain-containing protein [Microbacteriaceae bacterium K1510]|nr:DUF2865 domain-containing protein [Microbacteriaceae bacterium K1510]